MLRGIWLCPEYARDTSFDSSNLYHTFTKEIEFGRAAETKEEFMKPYIQSYLPVVEGEMLDVKDFISSQRALAKNHPTI
ncbi:MAG: hypothetical protein IPL46_11945 [Saprospiraceae bacterium]|nr:hypothetical protein [Saprospiraceae bacterium]